jgi:hypothetical protein
VRTRERKALYWLTTGTAAVVLASIGMADLLRLPPIMAGLAHLGYPATVATILGVWQLLGAAVTVAPGLRTAKEWAYAGMFFLLTGAAASHAASGDDPGAVLFPLLLLGVVMTSRALMPARDAAFALAPAPHPAR